MKPPEELDKLADMVLRYHPKPKSKAATKRKKKAALRALIKQKTLEVLEDAADS